MKKKYYAIGEVFKHENKTLIVVKWVGGLDCDLCVFRHSGVCADVPFECRKDYREDLIGVHFEEVKDEN